MKCAILKCDNQSVIGSSRCHLHPKEETKKLATCLKDDCDNKCPEGETYCDPCDGRTPKLVDPVFDQTESTAPLYKEVDVRTDCRTEEGVTVQIIDTVINQARLFKGRDIHTKAIRAALADLDEDEDVKSLMSIAATPVHRIPDPLGNGILNPTSQPIVGSTGETLADMVATARLNDVSYEKLVEALDARCAELKEAKENISEKSTYITNIQKDLKAHNEELIRVNALFLKKENELTELREKFRREQTNNHQMVEIYEKQERKALKLTRKLKKLFDGE